MQVLFYLTNALLDPSNHIEYEVANMIPVLKINVAPEGNSDVPLVPDVMKTVLLTYESVIDSVRDEIKAAELTEPQWRVLHELAVKSPMIASELAANTFVRASSLSRILRDLEARDLISRAQQFEDLRKTQVSLTEFGRAEIAAIEAKYNEVLRSLTSKVGPETIEGCVKACLAIVSHLAQGQGQDGE